MWRCAAICFGFIHVRKCIRSDVCERGLKKEKDGEKERGKKDMCVREADERFLIVIGLLFLLCIFGGFTHWPLCLGQYEPLFYPPPPFWERNHFLWKGDRERGRQRDRIGRRRKQGGWKSEKGMCGEIWRGIDSEKEMETKSVAEHEKRDMDRWGEG